MKAVKSGSAKIVYVAKDADEKLIKPLVELCHQSNVEVTYVPTMEKLGALCCINVGAAAACVVKE
ncbi:ribosomal L7Ae/L30e/S12e/Gadd45 family protein [Caloramator quimbayensis]|uniref:ribosomal L7Ae/L30e/S12e/Gadd45 family protein n=1 Tax=Caloramator quimbayensis TaxID=1147123 RepID=UPI00241D113C|nr:ribosomal L7Ae/L30e/S12e/Gadd45 family protein [Caloramator quimbayensis]